MSGMVTVRGWVSCCYCDEILLIIQEYAARKLEKTQPVVGRETRKEEAINPAALFGRLKQSLLDNGADPGPRSRN